MPWFFKDKVGEFGGVLVLVVLVGGWVIKSQCSQCHGVVGDDLSGDFTPISDCFGHFI